MSERLCPPLTQRVLTRVGADEKNRTSTALRQQASETCASTSSATSARVELLRILIKVLKLKKARCVCYI